VVTVDINTVIIPLTKRIWIVHPGKNRKFYNDFAASNRVYLEFPGLDLRDRDLDDDGAIRQHIRRSNAMVSHRGPIRDNGTTINLSDFPQYPDAATAVFLRTVRHLISHMEVGDLVVVPGYGAYSNLLFGEIAAPFDVNDRDRIAAYPWGDIHFRQVNWLSTDRHKQELPSDLIKYVGKPPAIAEVGRTASTERFFEFAYGSYVKEGQSWSTITAPSYRGNDPSAISQPTRLIEFAVSVYRAIELGRDISGLSMDEIIDNFYDARDIEHFGLSFNSPGRLDFKARDTTMAVFVSAVIALASAGMLSGCKAQSEPIAVINSKTSDPRVSATMQEQLNLMNSSISAPTAAKVDAIAQDSKAKTGLTTVATISGRGLSQ
jgi:hypothetical protein